jgi:hypothetical protein
MRIKKLAVLLAIGAGGALPGIGYSATILTPSLSGFTVLSVNGGDLILNQGDVNGTVGLGPNSTASSLQKSTVSGQLIVDPSATFDTSNFATDFHLLGGVVVQSLATAQSDANSLNSSYGALVAPAGNTFGVLDASTTFSGGAGQNVYSIGEVNFNSDVLTISGPSSSQFIINISGGFTFADSQIMLTGGVTRDNVLFNFPGGSTDKAIDIDVFKATNVIAGIFLAPHRSVIFKDPGSVYNVQIIGQDLLIHSGAEINGPPPGVPLPAALWGGMALTGGLVVAKVRKGVRQ